MAHVSAELLAAREEAHTLLGTMERYNPNNLDVFVDYVRLTVAENAYDLDAYLTVLKLFQFNPTTFDLPTACTVLTKAIMGMPDNDFFLCLCLLAPEIHEKREVKRLIYLSQLLETCRFAEFWAYLEDHQDVLDARVRLTGEDEKPYYEQFQVAGFRDSVREYAAHVIHLTYQEAPASVLSEMLGGLQDAALDAFAEKHKWQKRENGTFFVGSKEDVIKSKDIVESIDFASLVPLMAASQLR